ncbi:MAG: hypothetical protein LBD78_09215 [Spirochaetaceae bacterium]|nr:hypothetical protein [Spirochaetaceae bacterium]
MLRKIIVLLIVIFTGNTTICPDAMGWQEMKLIAEHVKVDFSLFPTTNVWEKKICSPVLDSPNKRNYRTIITNASKNEPNFDGKYRIVEFGMGSGIQYFFIIDLNTGNVYEGKFSSSGITYSLNSSLIIINPVENMIWEDNDAVPLWSHIEYIKWNGQEFVGLLVINWFIQDDEWR